MKLNNFFFNILLLCFIQVNVLIYPHGFGGYVYIKSNDCWLLASQIKNKQMVSSYDKEKQCYVMSSVKARGISVTNCYFKISLNNSIRSDIQCTPSQVFYVPTINQWIPACELKVGDELLNDKGTYIPITCIEFVKGILPVFTFEIKDTHTFFVGSQSVLTHNILAPFSFIGLSVAFGSGAAAGGSSGSFFGPITLVGGMVIGGVIGAVYYGCKSQKFFKYKLYYDPEAIICYLNKNKNKNEKSDSSDESTSKNQSSNSNDDDDFLKQLKSRAAKKARTNRFGNMYKDPISGLWWAIDKARHGGSFFKVFRETSKGFEHVSCADQFGRFILTKHKGPIGSFISFSEVIFKS